MPQAAMTMVAQSTDELVYIIAVLIFIGIGWVGERIKALMAERERRGQVPPRPGRRHPTSLPRPEIRETSVEPRPSRPVAPPPIQRPRPPARPPVPARPPAARTEPVRRPAGPPGPAARPRPAVTRTAEEARAIIRGEPAPSRPARLATPREAPAPVRPEPRPEPSAVKPAVGQSTLGQLSERSVAGSRPFRSLAPAEADESAAVRGGVRAASFRGLTSAELQRAFVLKEILEPPLAIRDL
ncbi:MAG TPA: hypothetical protein PL151_16950 [Phycisphaerae bacterium]|nr:hypothetical protein [Phycisphaerae bacterium]HOJ72839.1 hypothetical protein [Phycisphaerae bacterium]HPU25436.1 hypothetical protein [Phycisphaerae bacterium]HPZ99919.1 hypothetical protein [Phycisphaerae bacterium]HQE29449.1 hypothetical protein [Phycisphaerae bacterium]